LRMKFSLWLVALLFSVLSYDTSAAPTDTEDVTEMPDIVNFVDMRIVNIDDNLESVTEIVHEEETTLSNLIEEDVVSTTTTTTEAPKKLQVFQEVRKVAEYSSDDIVFIPVTTLEEALKQEEMELNEVASNLGDDDIVDVISNFIADKDPMLQLFLSICFIDPSCYQDTPPIVTNHQDNAVSGTKLEYSSSTARELVDNLIHRRTEKARNILISKLMDAQTRIKYLMFKYIEIGVGARGVSVLATKNIIDAIKNIWLSVHNDLEYAKSTLQRLFLVLEFDNVKIAAMADLVDVIESVPDKVEYLYEEATKDGFKDYVKHSSWDSWKRNPKDLN